MIFKLHYKNDGERKLWWWEFTHITSPSILKSQFFVNRFDAISNFEETQLAIESAPLVDYTGTKIDEVDLYPDSTIANAPVTFIFKNIAPDQWSWQAVNDIGEIIIDSKNLPSLPKYKTLQDALNAGKKYREQISIAVFVDSANVPISPAVLSKEYCERHQIIDEHPAGAYWQKRNNR